MSSTLERYRFKNYEPFRPIIPLVHVRDRNRIESEWRCCRIESESGSSFSYSFWSLVCINIFEFIISRILYGLESIQCFLCAWNIWCKHKSSRKLNLAINEHYRLNCSLLSYSWLFLLFGLFFTIFNSIEIYIYWKRALHGFLSTATNI
jgi:hypothetical protein